MIIEGKITNVTTFPIIEGKDGRTYKKAEAILEVPVYDNLKDVIIVTVIRSMGDIQPGWHDYVFNWTDPIDVKMTVSFSTWEYNGKVYQKATAKNCALK